MAPIQATILAPAEGDQRQRVERVESEPLGKRLRRTVPRHHCPETHPEEGGEARKPGPGGNVTASERAAGFYTRCYSTE